MLKRISSLFIVLCTVKAESFVEGQIALKNSIILEEEILRAEGPLLFSNRRIYKLNGEPSFGEVNLKKMQAHVLKERFLVVVTWAGESGEEADSIITVYDLKTGRRKENRLIKNAFFPVAIYEYSLFDAFQKTTRSVELKKIIVNPKSLHVSLKKYSIEFNLKIESMFLEPSTTDSYFLFEDENTEGKRLVVLDLVQEKLTWLSPYKSDFEFHNLYNGSVLYQSKQPSQGKVILHDLKSTDSGALEGADDNMLRNPTFIADHLLYDSVSEGSPSLTKVCVYSVKEKKEIARIENASFVAATASVDCLFILCERFLKKGQRVRSEKRLVVFNTKAGKVECETVLSSLAWYPQVDRKFFVHQVNGKLYYVVSSKGKTKVQELVFKK